MQKFKVGVIGLHMGREHLIAYQKSEHFEVIGICDVNKDLLEKMPEADRIPIKSINYMDLVNNDNIDLISVASPDHFHREHLIAALEAGKHVLCEKPLALTMDDCREIVETAKKSKSKFMIGQVCRFAPGFKMAKGIINNGLIGDLFFIESEYAHDYKNIPGWEGWRKDPKVSRNGVIGGGCHAIDLLRWIGGEVEEVSAYANHKMLKDWPQPDTTVAILKFKENQIIGKVFVSIAVQRRYTMRSVFYGSEGTIICDNISSNIKLYSNKIPGLKNFSKLPVHVASHDVASEVEYFYQCLIGKQKLELDVVEGANTVAVGLAIVESAKNSGKPSRVILFQR